MYILGITTLGAYNQAACLFKNNEIIAFAEEERFSRIKQSFKTFPRHSIDYCLEAAGIKKEDVGRIAIGWDTARNTWEKCHGADYAQNIDLEWDKLEWESDEFGAALYELADIDLEAQLIKEAIRYGFPIQNLHWYDHHECHAVSSISCSPFKECNYITMDGNGGASAGRAGYFSNGKMREEAYFTYLGSIGRFYEDITKFLGFKPHEQEGKTMGLACYGQCDESLLPRDIIFVNRGGLWQIDQNKVETFLTKLELQGVKQKIHENILCTESVNLAKTAQQYLEEVLLEAATLLYSKTGCGDFALSGGTALNCSANGQLIKEPFVNNLFIPPAAHDSGTALGAAILCSSEQSGWKKHIPAINFPSAYWGSSFVSKSAVEVIKQYSQLRYKQVDVASTLATLIHNNKIVGYCAGKAEIGPRALCHRSILANPTIASNLDKVNKIKDRELWRPLAPVIKEDNFNTIVDLKHPSPYMLIAAPVRDEWKKRIPAVTHIDGTCRPQSVNAEQNKIIYNALGHFEQLSGAPVFLNTSFNLKGEPLVDSAEDAIKTFLRSNLDYLILEDILVWK